MPRNFLNLMLVVFLFLSTSGNLLAQTDEPSKNDVLVKDLLSKANKNINKNPEKAFQYINQALEYKNEITPKQQVKLYEVVASAYSYQQSYLSALDYFYKTLDLQKKVDTPRLHYTYNNIGCTYMQLGDSTKARNFLYKSVESLKNVIAKGKSEEKSVEAFLVYSNLAVLEMERKNYEKALEMFHIYHKNSIRLKDTAGLVNTYQNLSNIFHSLKQKDSALFYSNRGIEIAKKGKLSNEIIYLYHNRGLNYRETQKDSAIYYLEKVFVLAKEKPLTDVKLSSSKELANLYEDQNNYKKATEYLRIANSLSEESMELQNKKKVELLEFENEQKAKQQEALVETQKRENILIFSVILILPIALVVFLMYRLQKTRANQRKIENELLIQKMEGKNKELTSNAIQMLQVSERIDATHKELNHLKSIADTPTKKMLSSIILDLKKGNQSFNKQEFEKLFIETDEEFYKKLLHEFPTLTKNEIRLCAFAKMNFSAKEISAVTHQSPNSILVGRSRLRKKLGLEEHQSLTAFLKNY
ncbi:tetratricopeptide (TPR) repeat protein [Flavobacterium arsenatis]|uniref:Tetratricopeptide (TPR) repeat protein n=1 Tax=Flavobacterium arsenatis TaxID=1484332 RepID=A0ABU1TLN4_9FLAO|nr:tetratricopeptide repeat protein [Flavobacterium arsenatis]MDR6966886.1 tetratricopeptide (TPR) repeat protein [Flavobacterium arsenatis]